MWSLYTVYHFCNLIFSGFVPARTKWRPCNIRERLWCLCSNPVGFTVCNMHAYSYFLPVWAAISFFRSPIVSSSLHFTRTRLLRTTEEAQGHCTEEIGTRWEQARERDASNRKNPTHPSLSLHTTSIIASRQNARICSNFEIWFSPSHSKLHLTSAMVVMIPDHFVLVACILWPNSGL